ncbi:MAG: OmpA family protein [Pseudomonadales bacterium]
MRKVHVFYFALVVFGLVLSNSAQRALAEPAVTIFTQPPAPEELADILYQPRYRSVQGKREKQPDLFGMMINFELDSIKILPESLPLLDSVGEMLTLERVKDHALVVEGHTDARGTHAHNQDLSERRALAIKKYLVDSFQVSSKRLVTVGQGETKLHDGSDPKNPLNRRVAFRPVKSIVVN